MTHVRRKCIVAGCARHFLPASHNSPNTDAMTPGLPDHERQQNSFRQLFCLCSPLGIAIILATYGVLYVVSPLLVFGPGDSDAITDTTLLGCMFMWLTGVALTGIATIAIVVKSVAGVLQFLFRNRNAPTTN